MLTMMIAATKEELSGLKHHMIVEDTVVENGYQTFLGSVCGKKTLLVQTGMGKDRVEKATMFVLEHYPISAIISIGFSGGLTPGLSAGDIVLCSTLCCNDGREDLFKPDEGLFLRSLQICDGIQKGKSVTVAQPASPEMKQALARAFQADVVDMESYWVARIANEKGVPFLAVRAVSDTLQERLVPIELGSDGGPDRSKIVLSSLFHPARLVVLARLQKNSRLARKNLTAFLMHFMERCR